MNNILGEVGTEIYSFDNYKIVLNTGLRTNDFSAVKSLNFTSLLKKIDLFYSDFNVEQYGNLVDAN